MRKIIFFIVLAFAISHGELHCSNSPETSLWAHSHIQLTPDEKSWLKHHPTIMVSNEMDYPPFDFAVDGKPDGYTIDLLDLLADKIGLQIEYVNGYTWAQLVDKFKKKELDLLHTLAKTPEREKIGLFSDPYMRLKSYLAVRKNSPDIHDIRQLYGKTVSVGKGWQTEEYLLRHHPQVNLLPVDGMKQMLDAVSRGAADATIASGQVIRYQLKKLGLTDLKLSGWFKEMDKGESAKYYFMAQKNAPELVSMLNRALESLTPGDIEPLEKKWFGSSGKAASKISLTLEEQQFIEQHPVIKVANDSGWPPFDFFEQGQARGYSMDYLRVLADILGIQLAFVQDQSWNQLINQFETRKVDVITTYEDSPRHRAWALFTEPFLETQESIITHKDAPFLGDYRDLYGKKVAIIKGYDYEPVIREHYPQIRMVLVDTPVQGLKMVSFGKADAMIENSAVASYLMRTNGIVNLRLAGDPTIPGTEVGDKLNIAVRKDWPLLHALFVKAMRAVPQTTLTQLDRRWLYAGDAKPSRVTLTTAERASLNKKGVIKFSTIPDYRPYEWISDNGRHDGISADILDLFAKRLNTTFELVPTKNWGQSLQNLRQRKCDILPIAIDTSSRHDVMNFTTPYFTQPLVVVTGIDGEFINEAGQLGRKPIGIIKNSAFTELLKTKNPEFNAVDVENAKDGLLKVQKKEIYGYIDSMPAVGYLMQKNAMTDLKIAGRLNIDIEICIASRKDEPLLGQIMQKAVDSLSEREKTQVVGKWISVKYEKGTDYVLIFKILLTVMVVVAIITWWNRKLSKANKTAQQALKALEEKSLELEKIAVTDRLTGLFNRVKLEEALNAEYEKAKRFSRVFSVIIVDVDHFKKVNDTYGHTIGDKVLVSLSRILQRNTRAVDTVGRWGGEEFLIVACETNLDGAVNLAEKLKAAIEAFEFPVAGRTTASFGVTTLKPGEEIKDLIVRADQALYNAKNNGRNRVESLDGSD